MIISVWVLFPDLEITDTYITEYDFKELAQLTNILMGHNKLEKLM